jgi:GAF domain-containing protein
LLRQTRQLRAVTEIGQRLISTLDYRQVLRQLMQEVIPLFNVERGSFWTINQENGVVEFEFSLNHEGVEDEISDAIRELPEETFRLGSGFVGQVALSGRPLIQNEVATNKQHLKEVDIISKHTTRCILTVPLLRNELTVGVIQLLNPMDREQFGLADQEMLLMLTPWVALALENAKLYQMALTQLEMEHQNRIRAELEAQAAGMLTVMAHHLKNQLGSARMHLHHVRNSEGLTEKQAQNLQKTDENMKRSIQITQSLLKPYVFSAAEYAQPANLCIAPGTCPSIRLMLIMI